MKQFGLIGKKLGHSFSQNYFNQKFANEGIDAEYINFELSDIGEFMEVIAEYPLLCGLNVTIPYKTLIIPYLDALSPAAESIGAVNVVEFTGTSENPSFCGHNTDATGFMDDLSVILTKPFPSGALVLGSGGASKAVCFALRSMGIEPLVVSREPKEGMITYRDIDVNVLATYPLIVNTTPLGMWPDCDSCPDIPYDLLGEDNICYDLVYNPQPTLFLEKAAQRGAITRGGRGMLINQAELSWKIWNNIK